MIDLLVHDGADGGHQSAALLREESRISEKPGAFPMRWVKQRGMANGNVHPEVVRKFRSPAVNLQVTAQAWSFCKSVGVCLRRSESCTCHLPPIELGG
jgi:hypothetical protein